MVASELYDHDGIGLAGNDVFQDGNLALDICLKLGHSEW